MITVEPFVERYFIAQGYLNRPSKIIAAENYPNPNTYFYRSLNPAFANIPNTPNSFFSNIINVLGITGATEKDLLDNFLNSGYRLIDCFDITKAMHPINDIIHDIHYLNAEKVLFLTDNNINTIKEISVFEDLHGIVGGISNKIIPDLVRGRIVHSFPNWPSQVINFKNSIELAVRLGLF